MYFKSRFFNWYKRNIYLIVTAFTHSLVEAETFLAEERPDCKLERTLLTGYGLSLAAYVFWRTFV
jgi:hypothetical protein